MYFIEKLACFSRNYETKSDKDVILNLIGTSEIDLIKISSDWKHRLSRLNQPVGELFSAVFFYVPVITLVLQSSHTICC